MRGRLPKRSGGGHGSLALIAMIAILSLAARSATAQMGAGIAASAKLDLSRIPANARTAFVDGVGDLANIFVSRGVTRLEQAIQAEPGFGLARVFWARQAPGLTLEQRTVEMDRGVADAAKGSAGEVAFAMALRAQRLNQPDDARSLFRTARQLLPGDPYIAFYAVQGTLPANATVETQVLALRRLVEQFPDLAPAYNNLAYILYRNGNRSGAMDAVRKYVELAPNHPNAKDSYAELLQWEGRFDQSLALYREAAQLDPTYAAAYTGIADVQQLAGKGDMARAALAEGLALAPNAAAKANLHRLIALSFAAEGNRKGAEDALGMAMTDVKDSPAPALVSGIHRDFAQVNAMTGNMKGVAPHLTATTNPNAASMTVDAMLLAAAGMNDEARARLEEAAATPNEATNGYVESHAPIVSAMIMVNEGNAEGAIAEIAKGDITLPLAQAVSALAEQQRKNTVVARLLRDRVLADPVYAIGNREQAMARALAKRVK